MSTMAPNLSKPEISFSFAGCGFLGAYHVGVISCLQLFVPHLVKKATYYGASAGALIASCLLCNASLNDCIDFILRLAQISIKYPLGGWEPDNDIESILRSTLNNVLPADAHVICTDRLFVSITAFPSFRNELVSKFSSKKELIDVLLCSAHIPLFSGYDLPQYKGQTYIDGGLSDNMPVVDENTITICPWAGESSICPQDSDGMPFPVTAFNTSLNATLSNYIRFWNAFFPPEAMILKNYCWQGFDDANRFLMENELIHCNVHRVLTHLTHLERKVNPRASNCADCHHHRLHARNTSVPQEILDAWRAEDNERTSLSYISILTESVKKMINMWLIPCTIIRFRVMRLYMQPLTNPFEKGFQEEFVHFLTSFRSPRTLLYNTLCYIGKIGFFLVAEYVVRFLSEFVWVMKYIGMVFSKRPTCQYLCLQCGVKVSEPVVSVKTDARDMDPGPTDDDDPEVVVVPMHEAQARQDDIPVVVLDGQQYGQTAAAARGPRETALQGMTNLAVSLGIKTNSVEMAIPLKKRSGNGADAEAASETVHVETVGEIEDVCFDRMAMARETFKKSTERLAEQRAAHELPTDDGATKTDSTHHCVQKLGQYRNVMTMHYVDEDHMRHTESLFMEDVLSHLVAEAQKALESGGAHKLEEKLEEIKVRLDPLLGEEVSHDLKTLLKKVIDKQLMGPQREFELEYQLKHQQKLMDMNQSEVLVDTGYFHLLVVAFKEKLNSLSSGTDTDDCESFVRSVLDASSLVGRIQKSTSQEMLFSDPSRENASQK